jgi:lipopolysaccharide/colanic/teichoic acid biosynthesis glycosyltransferase
MFTWLLHRKYVVDGALYTISLCLLIVVRDLLLGSLPQIAFHIIFVALVFGVYLGIARATGLYAGYTYERLLDEWKVFTHTVALTGVVVSVWLMLFRTESSRLLLVGALCLLWLGGSVARLVFKRIQMRKASQGEIFDRVYIAGSFPSRSPLYRAFGLDLVAFGNEKDVRPGLTIALRGNKTLLPLLGRLLQTGCDVYVDPYMFTGERSEVLFQSILCRAKMLQTTRFERVLRRVVDCAASAGALTVLSPFIACIRLYESIAPATAVFFTQERVGYLGKRFKIWKIRSMSEVYTEGEVSKRVTVLGKVLRRFSLDELPQMWNIFKGDMSIIGPRPELVELTHDYVAWERLRLSVKPGLTGLWQVSGRKDVPLQEHIELDLYYILTRSVWTDLKIIMYTIPLVILGRGAY